MKAFKMKDRPNFKLVKHTDTGASEYLQMPRWLISGENPLSLEASVAYTLLFNRMLLSKSQGWVNESGEVFLIYTREELAQTLKISYRRATAAFRELLAAELIWEKRTGRGFANQIYIAAVDRERPCNEQTDDAGQQSEPFKNVQNDCSRTAELKVQEPQFCPTSNIDNNKQEVIYLDNSLSVADAPQTGDDILSVLEKSETASFPVEVASVFNAAIVRLYRAKCYDSDAGMLLRPEIRRYLQNLNSVVLESVYEKVSARTGKIHSNQIGYMATAILNAVIDDNGRSNKGIYHKPDYLSGFCRYSLPEAVSCG